MSDQCPPDCPLHTTEDADLPPEMKPYFSDEARATVMARLEKHQTAPSGGWNFYCEECGGRYPCDASLARDLLHEVNTKGESDE